MGDDDIYTSIKKWYVKKGISTQQFFKDTSTEMGMEEMVQDFAFRMLKGEGILKSDTTKIMFDKKYEGFESVSDLSRDLHEMWDERFNPVMKDISGEFQGTVKVKITYED